MSCWLAIAVFLFSRGSLKEKLAAAFDVADVLITSGGVSMGEMVLHDLLHSIGY